jgi:hypothetical protein
MRRILKIFLAIVGVLIFCAPAAFVITFLLAPLWTWIESHYQIESIGHSGPADWCFYLVYGVLVSIFLAAVAALNVAFSASRRN